MKLKKIFRPIFYRFFNDKIRTIQQPTVLKGLRWIISKRFGLAYFKGYYEPEIVRFLISQVRDGDSFLDIGGHAGYFSYIFSRISPDGKVYTFEPDIQNCEFIRKIIVLNSIKNINLVNKAVGSSVGEICFTPGPTSSTGKVTESGESPISVTTIDRFLENNTLKGDVLLKIDVEGHGGEVLKGATETIGKYKPTILMELHDDSNERDELIVLGSLGYQFYNLKGSQESIRNHQCRFFVARIGK